MVSIRRHGIFFAGIGTILTVTAYAAIDEIAAKHMWIVQLNRLMSVVVLWIVAALSYFVKRTLYKTEEAEIMIRTVVDNAVDGIITIDERGIIESSNKACQSIFGYRSDEVIGHNVKMLMPEPYHGEHDGYLEKYRKTKQRKIIGAGREVVGRRRDGASFPVDLSVSEVHMHGRRLYSGIVRDITERRLSQDRLYAEKERLRLTLESIGDAVITTDSNGIVDYINPVAETLTGYTLADAKDKPLSQVFSIVDEHDRQAVPSPVNRCMAEGEIVGLGNHTILINRRGEEYSIQDSAAPIRGRGGEILGAILVFSDVTEERRLNKQIAYQASHDALTDLVNRREFDGRLRRAAENAKRVGNVHALCYLDLDQFKVVNDTCGHVAGDELLCQISALLRQRIRARDTLARLGGDEFGILMEHCNVTQAKRVADGLQEAVQQYRFGWEGKTFNIGVSVGVVGITDTCGSAVDLLMQADTACYAAKRAGRNRVHVYQTNNVELTQHQGEIQWVSRINDALENDRFRLYFQPIRSSKGSEGLHYELLLRLQGENGEIIPPGAFMGAAERFGLITKIDCWVIKAAFHWLKSQQAHLEQLYQCSINLAGSSLGSQEVLTCIITELHESGVAPGKVCFEITESAAIANLRHAVQFMETLRLKGCRFALDDFGSGLSSFAYLKNLPVDYLKIDGVFVRNIVTDPTDQAMVKSINEIGHVMGKQTIAEFAEDDETIQCLKAIGVDFVQGFGVAHPRPIEELEYFEV